MLSRSSVDRRAEICIILQCRAIEESSFIVEVSRPIDYRQTITVGSFITKLNLFNWKIDRLVGDLQSTLVYCELPNKNLLISLNFQAVSYVNSTSTVVSADSN